MSMVESKTLPEKVLHGVNIALLALLSVLFILPVWHCLMASFSEPLRLLSFQGLLLRPMGGSLEGTAVHRRSRRTAAAALPLFLPGERRFPFCRAAQ